MVPLAEPNVDIATDNGINQKNDPKIRSPNVWNIVKITLQMNNSYSLQGITNATASLIIISDGVIIVRYDMFTIK